MYPAHDQDVALVVGVVDKVPCVVAAGVEMSVGFPVAFDGVVAFHEFD